MYPGLYSIVMDDVLGVDNIFLFFLSNYYTHRFVHFKQTDIMRAEEWLKSPKAQSLRSFPIVIL